MLGYYTPVLLLQAFCLYHAYKNGTQQRWYWLILFFPLVGCLIYLYNNFYSKNNVRTIAESVKVVINTNYRMELLEKELRFSDTVSNKTNLADEYMKNGRYEDAIVLYGDCLKGFMADDPTIRTKLVHAYYLHGAHHKAIEYGCALESEKSFRNAEERIAYAQALHRVDKTEEAEIVFLDMDRTFTNYPHRMAYCKFLMETDKRELAKEKLAELVAEFEHMGSAERRLKRTVIKEISGLYNSIMQPQ